MKKIAAVLPVLVLTACGIYAGNSKIVPEYNSFFEIKNTEDIFFYSQPQDEEMLTSSKTITEENIKKGEVLTTDAGDIMAFEKTYRTDFFEVESLRVNKDAVLESSSVPYVIKKGAIYTGFGEVTVDGKRYMLVRQGKNDNDILLLSEDGEVYNRIGRIVKGRLALLDAPFFANPEDVQFVPVVSTRSERSDYIGGFELRYDGVKNGEMIFTYTTLGEDCYDEEFSFPLGAQNIEIYDLKINVLQADKKSVQYIIS